MSEKLLITGSVVVTVNKKRETIGVGTEVTEIDLPDKKYGLKRDDVDRIVSSGCGVISKGIKEDASDDNDNNENNGEGKGK